MVEDNIIKPEDFLWCMSFNIRNMQANDGQDQWENRRDMVASMFRFHRVDVAGLQEAYLPQVCDLEKRLPGYDWVGVGRDDGEKEGEFNPVFFRRDRFKLRGWRTRWLSEQPEQAGSLGWDAVCRRLMTWTVLEDLRNGTTFCFLNTHFDHRGRRAQVESARLLLETVDAERKGRPVIVTGDFNIRPESRPYSILTGKEEEALLFDARQITRYPHHGPEFTFCGFEGLQGESKRARIDYIFVTEGVGVRQHGVLCDAWNDRYPSDHFPVLAEIHPNTK